MKKMLLFLAATFSLFAAVPTIYMAPPASSARATAEKEPQKESKAPPSTNPLAQIESGVAAKTASSKGSTEMMIISPEGRAKDIQAAIKYLKLHAPTSKPKIKLTNGSTISGILSVDIMPGGTLLIFKVGSLKGVRYEIEKIENIDTIETNGT